MLLTPGLYRQPALPVRATGPLSRGDVTVFLGYAARGPVGAAGPGSGGNFSGVPVRVESLPMFEGLFGPPPGPGFLWYAVKGFFETGGVAAYVLRLADSSATAASAELSGPGGWTARASFPWPMIDPRRLTGAGQAAAATWVQILEAQIREGGERSPDPGTWGNGLELSIARSPRARTVTLPDAGAGDPLDLRLSSLAGVERASVLELTQLDAAGEPLTVHLVPEEIDTARVSLRLQQPASRYGLDATRPIRIASVEFGVEIRRDGRLEQVFEGLGPDPAHSQALAATLQRDCRSLHLDPPEGVSDWSSPSSWPPEGTFPLRGGTDGLTGMTSRVWLSALPAVARLSEAALIAAPDLVLPASGPLDIGAGPIPEVLDCTDLSIPPEGRLAGRVTTGDHPGAPGSGEPVAGAEIDVTGPGGRTTTDADGAFEATGIAVGLVTLRITKPGFEPLELLVQSSPFAGPPQPFELQPLTTPRALTEDEVLEVATALGNPDVVGPYKVAILDPPAADARLDDLRTWRSRLGDNARLGFFGPWLRLPAAGGTLAATAGGSATSTGALLDCPASGHVCGAFAAAERGGGIHRTGANRPLRFADGLTLPIDDGEQGVLNPAGINAIRAFPGRGIRANGTRSLSSDPAWRFLTTRRIVDAIERTLERSLAWVVFEPNNLLTRHTVTVAVQTFLDGLWRGGVLAGDKAAAAYQVKCDTDNNSEEDQAAGRLYVDVGVAPTEPYEFVLFRLGTAEDALKVTE
jgi:Bacteriophage tail sheath protein